MTSTPSFTAWRQALALGTLAAAGLMAGPAIGQGLEPDLPNGCSAAVPVTCRYQQHRNFTPSHFDMVLSDAARGNHRIPVRVRFPVGANGAVPVVIWSHGGAVTNWTGLNAQGVPISFGQTGSERRGRSFAAAGYVVVHVGRLPVEDAALTTAQLDDCQRIGVGRLAALDGDTATDPRVQCRNWTGFHLYGPQNVAYVAAHLADIQAAMPRSFAGSLNRERIVIGGWSGGTESVMNIAGAAQAWPPVHPYATGVSQPSIPVPGVVAFFADAPRRPAFIAGSDASGFSDSALAQIGQRPFLFNTGKNDVGPDVAPPVARALPWISAQPGGKLLAWDRSGIANHSTMNLGNQDNGVEEGCAIALGQGPLCLWYEDLGMAFMDAAARQRREAIRWLASDAVKALTGGQIELHRR